MMKKVVRGVWAFCVFLFVPQWDRHQKGAGSVEPRN